MFTSCMSNYKVYCVHVDLLGYSKPDIRCGIKGTMHDFFSEDISPIPLNKPKHPEKIFRRYKSISPSMLSSMKYHLLIQKYRNRME